MGIFQLESAGVRRVLKEMKPSSFEDVISVLALYVVDNVTTYFVRPVQIEDQILVRPLILETSRRTCKMDIVVTREGSVVCKAVMTLQSIDHA